MTHEPKALLSGRGTFYAGLVLSVVAGFFIKAGYIGTSVPMIATALYCMVLAALRDYRDNT